MQLELSDANYYHGDDKLRISHNLQSDELREVREVKHEMIAKRKLKYDDEQTRIRNSMAELQQSRERIARQLEDVNRKKREFADTVLSLKQSDIVKRELADKRHEFHEADVHRSAKPHRYAHSEAKHDAPAQGQDQDAMVKRVTNDMDNILLKIKRNRSAERREPSKSSGAGLAASRKRSRRRARLIVPTLTASKRRSSRWPRSESCMSSASATRR